METKKTGKVVWFNDNKGFGFLAQDDGSEELFVHYSNIEIDGFKTLTTGQSVAYKIGANHRGPQAVEVEVIGEPEEE